MVFRVCYKETAMALIVALEVEQNRVRIMQYRCDQEAGNVVARGAIRSRAVRWSGLAQRAADAGSEGRSIPRELLDMRWKCALSRQSIRPSLRRPRMCSGANQEDVMALIVLRDVEKGRERIIESGNIFHCVQVAEGVKVFYAQGATARDHCIVAGTVAEFAKAVGAVRVGAE